MRPGQAACYIEAPPSPKTIAAIAISIFVPQLAIFSNQLFGSVVAGFLSGAVSSGSLQGGLAGAFSAGLFFGIGKAPWTSAAEGSKGFLGSGLTAGAFGGKIVAHGMAGGVMAKLQGGNFGSGFASAGFAQAFSPAIGSASTRMGRVISASLVGGTASVLSGGKFANGAVTAAFSRAFNDEVKAHRQRDLLDKLTNDEVSALVRLGQSVDGIVRIMRSTAEWHEFVAKLSDEQLQDVTKYFVGDSFSAQYRSQNIALLEQGMSRERFFEARSYIVGAGKASTQLVYRGPPEAIIMKALLPVHVFQAYQAFDYSTVAVQAAKALRNRGE